MSKEIADFVWPTPQYPSAGRNFRVFIERAMRLRKESPNAGDAYTKLTEHIHKASVEGSKRDVRDAGSIAVMYIAYLIEQGIIPPLQEDLYP